MFAFQTLIPLVKYMKLKYKINEIQRYFENNAKIKDEKKRNGRVFPFKYAC